MINPTTHYALADFISALNLGMARNMRFTRINKTPIALRLVHLLYMQGILRTYKIESEHVAVYYKYVRSRHIVKRYTLVSKPSKRCYWTLSKLVKVFNANSFSGFYVIPTQKGIFTSDYCLLQGHMCGEVLFRVNFG
jgi:ribosomal protein S8